MSQRHGRDFLNVIVGNRSTSLKRGERTRSAHDREFATMSVHFKIRTKLRDLLEHRAFDSYLQKVRASARNSFAELLLIGGKRFVKLVAIAIVAFAALHDVYPILQVVFRFDFCMQAKPIQ